MTTTNATTDSTRLDELESIRRELRSKQKYVRETNPELFAEIAQWCDEAREPSATGIRDLVRNRLSELKRDHEMRDHRSLDNPEEGFPDDCEGCENYGVACPMVKNYLVMTELEQILDSDEDPNVVMRDILDLASRKGCDVLMEAIDDWRGDSQGLLRRGERLLNLAHASISDDLDIEDFPGADDLDDVVTVSESDRRRETPPPSVREDVERTVQGVEQAMRSDGGED